MRATNYFKARGAGAEQTFAFDHWDRRSIGAAFARAAAFAATARGRLSVFQAPPLSGPWDSVPAILPAEAPLSVWRRRSATPPARLALFGEGGVW